jgi:hypothetical protein
VPHSPGPFIVATTPFYMSPTIQGPSDLIILWTINRSLGQMVKVGDIAVDAIRQEMIDVLKALLEGTRFVRRDFDTLPPLERLYVDADRPRSSGGDFSEHL